MGQDKSLLPWMGKTLLQHQYDTLCDALAGFAAEIFISGERPGYKCVPDLRPGLGPLAGLEAAFAQVGEGGVLLIVPVDMPALTAGTLKSLLLAADGFDGAHFSGHPLPLVLNATPATAAALTRVLNSPERGQRSLSALVARLPVNVSPPTEIQKKELINLNAYHEYENMRETYNESSL